MTGILLVGVGAAAGVDPRWWPPSACGLQMPGQTFGVDGAEDMEDQWLADGELCKPALGLHYGLLGCE
jgi:hypothetical protein